MGAKKVRASSEQKEFEADDDKEGKKERRRFKTKNCSAHMAIMHDYDIGEKTMQYKQWLLACSRKRSILLFQNLKERKGMS